jgi:hypothetical protein
MKRCKSKNKALIIEAKTWILFLLLVPLWPYSMPQQVKKVKKEHRNLTKHKWRTLKYRITTYWEDWVLIETLLMRIRDLAFVRSKWSKVKWDSNTWLSTLDKNRVMPLKFSKNLKSKKITSLTKKKMMNICMFKLFHLKKNKCQKRTWYLSWIFRSGLRRLSQQPLI